MIYPRTIVALVLGGITSNQEFLDLIIKKKSTQTYMLISECSRRRDEANEPKSNLPVTRTRDHCT